MPFHRPTFARPLSQACKTWAAIFSDEAMPIHPTYEAWAKWVQRSAEETEANARAVKAPVQTEAAVPPTNGNAALEEPGLRNREQQSSGPRGGAELGLQKAQDQLAPATNARR